MKKITHPSYESEFAVLPELASLAVSLSLPHSRSLVTSSDLASGGLEAGGWAGDQGRGRGRWPHMGHSRGRGGGAASSSSSADLHLLRRGPRCAGLQGGGDQPPIMGAP